VLQFIQRFFGREPSSATAKERLRLVLLSDHLSLAPEIVDALKHDLIDVISRYLDVDVPNCDVTFEQRDKEIAMLANIPILGMRPRPTAAPPLGPPPAAAPQLDLGSGATGLVAVLDREPVAVAPPPEEPVAEAPQRPKSRAKPQTDADGTRPTRRKRRKGMQQSTTAPAT
jgi:cell division topological specificity factor